MKDWVIHPYNHNTQNQYLHIEIHIAKSHRFNVLKYIEVEILQ